MGVMDFVRNGVREMMIARPDNLKTLAVYKHPDQNVPMYSQLTVDSDECAVFFKDGRVVGVLPAGRHTLQTQNIPFLNNIVTNFTGGQVFISEIFFVTTVPFRVPFGGQIGVIRDPQLKALVNPRIFGEMSIVITDPVQFIVGYARQGSNQTNEQLTEWIRELFKSGVRQTIGEFCIKQKVSLIEINAYQAELTASFVSHAPAMNETGIRILTNTFNLNFTPEDDKKLNDANERFVVALEAANIEVQLEQIKVGGAAAKAQQKQFELDQKFNQDAKYVQQLAGNYQNYAAGQAMIGAGQGMAEHGVGDGGIAGLGAQAAIGMGIGGAMGGAFTGQPQFGGRPASPSAPEFTPTAAVVTCGKCNTAQPQGKFCNECGNALAQQKKFCTSCGQETHPGVKFCANCGTAAKAPAAPIT